MTIEIVGISGLLVAGLVGYGALRQKVRQNGDAIEKLWRNKQDLRTCCVQHQAIMRELDTIIKKLDRLNDHST